MRKYCLLLLIFSALSCFSQVPQLVSQVKLPGYIRYMDVHPSKKLLAIANDKSVQVLDINSLRIVYTIPYIHTNYPADITSVAFDAGTTLYIRAQAYQFGIKGERIYSGKPTIQPFDLTSGFLLPLKNQSFFSFDLLKNWTDLPEAPSWARVAEVTPNSIFFGGDTSIVLRTNRQESEEQEIKLELKTCDFIKSIDRGEKLIVADLQAGRLQILNAADGKVIHQLTTKQVTLNDNTDCFTITGRALAAPCTTGIHSVFYFEEEQLLYYISGLNTFSTMDIKTGKVKELKLPGSDIVTGLVMDNEHNRGYVVRRNFFDTLSKHGFGYEQVMEIHVKTGNGAVLEFGTDPMYIDQAIYVSDRDSILISSNGYSTTWDGKSLTKVQTISPLLKKDTLTDYLFLSKNKLALLRQKITGSGLSQQHPYEAEIYNVENLQLPLYSVSLKFINRGEFVAVSPTGNFAITADKKKLLIWDISTAKIIREFTYQLPKRFTGRDKGIDFISSDGKYIFLRDSLQQKRLLLETTDWQLVYSFPEGSNLVVEDCLYSFTENGNFAACIINERKDSLIYFQAQGRSQLVTGNTFSFSLLQLGNKKAILKSTYAGWDKQPPSTFFLNRSEKHVGFVFPFNAFWNEPQHIVIRNTANDSLLYYTYNLPPENITGVSVSANNRLLLNFSQYLGWYDFSRNAMISLVYPSVNRITNELDALFLDAEMHYMGKASVNSIAFRIRERAYPIEQFDMLYNRPDLVLKNLGAKPEIIDAYAAAYAKRVEKSGITFSAIRSIPTIKIINSDTFSITRSPQTELQILARDELLNIKKVRLAVNNVPVKSGVTFVPGRSVRLYSPVTLTAGANRVSVTAVNEDGTESLPGEVTIFYNPLKLTKPRIFYAGLAVQEYADTLQNLSYTVKDVEDVSKAILSKYPDAFIRLLTNKQVTKDNVKALSGWLSQVKEEDIVILSMSGHGLITEKKDFYFASYDTDFKNPSGNGISLELVESLLDSTLSRKKILFVDACNSGELDKSQNFKGDSSYQVKGGLVKLNRRGIILETQNQQIGLKNSFALMQELFHGFAKSNGSTILAAAAGTEVAFEGDKWKNGLFTYSLIRGLASMEADINKDKAVTVNELINYVTREVKQLSNGLQNPSSRSVNFYYDWEIWNNR